MYVYDADVRARYEDEETLKSVEKGAFRTDAFDWAPKSSLLLL
jgi:hypothetical protein